MNLLFQHEIIKSQKEDGLYGFVEVGEDVVLICEHTLMSSQIQELILADIQIGLQQELSIHQILSQIYSRFHLLSITMGMRQEDVWHIANKGGGNVWLKRKDKTGIILSRDQYVKGKIDLDDVLFITSANFNKYVSKSIQHTLLGSTDTLAINTKQHADTAEGSSIAVVLLVTNKQKKQTLIPAIGIDNIISSLQFQKKIERIKRWIFQESAENQDPQQTKTKQMLLTIAIVLICLLVASIFLNINYSRNEAAKQKLAQALSLVAHQYDESLNLIDLNPIRARSLLSDSKLTLGQLMKEFPKDSGEYEEISGWVEKVSEIEVAAYKIYKITQAPVFFDLVLIKGNGEAQKIASYKETKALLDMKNQTIYSLGTKTKASEIVIGPADVGDATSITVHGKRIYFYKKDGIFGVDIGNKKAQKIISADEKWGEIVDISAFGGNLYLLDKTNNQIWKYISTGEGFSSRTTYLNSDVRIDFSDARRLIVDGSVWVLAGEANIMKFNRGLPEPFDFSGFSEQIDAVTSLSTSDIDKYIYILDQNGSRIVVLDKDGVYQSQYQWEELKNIVDFVVSEEEKKIFLVASNKIYAIDIK